ncbi:hypothetical protein V2J09_022037 [Rumex salicifolius]
MSAYANSSCFVQFSFVFMPFKSGNCLQWAQSEKGNTGYKAMDKLKARLCDVVFCKKNFAVLQTKVKLLKEEVDEVQNTLVSGENKDEFRYWLAEANKILQEANCILEGTSNMADKKRLCGTCWDPTFSWETGDMLRDVDKILEQRKSFDLSSISSYINKLESREKMLQDTLEDLMDIQIDVIGIYGMIGVGKTALAKELASHAQKDQLFDVVVMVQVSQSLDVKLIQTQIANKIGLQLLEFDDEETRAHFLYNKLKETITMNEQENNTNPIQQCKILVILDGIQHVIDLVKVGLTVKGTKMCKVVLLSRNADVCKEMGAEKIFRVECLNLEESKVLFRGSLNDKMQSMEITPEKYQYMESVMLVKCGGLPLMINSLACELRSMSWSNWDVLSDKMVRHALLEVDESKEVPCAILELCNNFIQKGIKHKLFLLCCLIHEPGIFNLKKFFFCLPQLTNFGDMWCLAIGVDVPLGKLMRYGIGFGLFEDDLFTPFADWIHELRSLSLLLETKPQHVKIHNVIQNVGISSLSQGDNILPVLMDVGTCWHTRKSYENCVAISMIPDSNYKFLVGLELDKLQAFLLKNKSSSSLPCKPPGRMPDLNILDIPENFFEVMKNLKILEISDTKLEKIPLSIRYLKNLVTLHLEYCDIKGEIISKISELDKLEVLMKMVRLRELYLYGSYSIWNTSHMEKLSKLPLEVVEIVLTRQMSGETLNFGNLRRFRVCVGRQFGDLDYTSHFSSELLIKDYGVLEVLESSLRDLLPRTEFLQIEGVSDLSNNIADLYAHVFLNLKSISIARCQIKCILDASKDVFPDLEILTLQKLSKLTSICGWQRHLTFFPQLRELRLTDLKLLHPYILPAQFAVKLRVMEVTDCISLLYIFPTETTDEIDRAEFSLDLPYMERLKLKGLENLQAFKHSLEDSIERDEGRLLFNDKIKFPSLKRMHLSGLDQIENLWDLSGSKECAAQLLRSQPYGKSPWFGNLKYMKVSHCYKLRSLFPSTVVSSLSQLETLKVDDCGKLKEVICSTDVEDDANPTSMTAFPRLKLLRLMSLTRLQCFYRGHHLLELPMLKELHLIDLRQIKAFSLRSTQSVETEGTILFEVEIDFPSLEQLEVSRVYHIELLQRNDETTRFPQLSRLILKGLPNLKALPSIHSKTLKFLDPQGIDDWWLFSNQPTFMSSMSLIMPWKIEELRLSEFDSLEELTDDLKKLELRKLGQLRMIPWNTLTSLTCLIISNVHDWTSIISTTLLVGGSVLPLLEYVSVHECDCLKAILSVEELKKEDRELVKYGITLFPSLKEIQLTRLPKLEFFSMGSYEAHFPPLETVDIVGCSSLQSFSFGPITTPILKTVKLDGKTMEQAERVDDLNSAVAGIHNFLFH